MQEERKQLLNEQIKTGEEIAVLGNDFAQVAEEEINFLNIVCGNL